MGKTAEEKARARYADQLGNGIEPKPLTDANRAILEEVRKEVERARGEVQAAARAGQEAVRRQTRKSKAELQEATAQGKREIEAVVENAAKRLKAQAAPEEAATQSPRAAAAHTVPAEPVLPEQPGQTPAPVDECAALPASLVPMALPAPRSSPRAALALRAAQALAKERGTDLNEVPSTPRWFEDYVDEFFCSSQAYHLALRAGRRPITEEAKQSIDSERSRCRACKKEGWSKTYPWPSCEKHFSWDCKFDAQIQRVEESVRDEFADQAAQAALDRKEAEDERARQEEEKEAEAARVRQEQRARAFETMKPLCLRCPSCIDMDFGVYGHEMCFQHRKEFQGIL